MKFISILLFVYGLWCCYLVYVLSRAPLNVQNRKLQMLKRNMRLLCFGSLMGKATYVLSSS